jgi:hypothetical protein
MARERCNCGCGQPTAATMRMRKLKCDVCGCPLRMSRSWLELNGSPACGCGGSFEPECLEDRCRLPGEEGQVAWAEYMGRQTFSAIQSDRAKRGHAKRRRVVELRVETPEARRKRLEAMPSDQRAMVTSPREYHEIPF